MIKIFHHNDMDGYASLCIIRNYLNKAHKGEEIAAYPVNYSKKDYEHFATITEEDIVYIVDYSFTTAATMQDLKVFCETARSVIWIDHHDSSMEVVKELERHPFDYHWVKNLHYLVSKQGSGAWLCYWWISHISDPDSDMSANRFYGFLQTEYPIPFWVQLVSDYDTFGGKYKPQSDYFKLAYDMQHDRELHFDYYLLFEAQGRSDKVADLLNKDLETGKILKNYIDSDNAAYLKAHGYESKLPDGRPIYVVNRKSNSWIFGDLYEKYGVVVVYAYNGTEYNYSMYSCDPEFSAAEFAERFGGGGHKGAAGWRCDWLMFVKDKCIGIDVAELNQKMKTFATNDKPFMGTTYGRNQ